MKYCFLFLSVIGAALTVGCDHNNGAAVEFIAQLGSDIDQRKLKSYKIRSLAGADGYRYLVSSEESGLVLLDSHGDVLQRPDYGDSKSFDLIEQSSLGDAWIARVEERGNRVVISEYRAGESKFHDFEWDKIWPGTLSVVCLGDAFDPDERDSKHYFQLWAITEQGVAYQTMMQSEGDTIESWQVRQVSLGEGVNSCAMNRYSQRLFWSQQGVGVLSINASEERDEERKLHLPISSQGTLQEAPSDLNWIAENQFLITAQGQAGLYDAALKPDQFAFLTGVFPQNLTSVAALRGSASLGVSSIRALAGVTDEGERVWQAGNVDLNVRTESAVATVPTFNVTASAETQPVNSYGDAADDPEVWVDYENPSNSVILGTDKQKGLWSYTLSGDALQFLPRGKLNNVDIRQSLRVNGELIDVAVATNRTTNNVDVYWLNSVSKNVQLLEEDILDGSLGEPYGACLAYHPDTNELMLFVNNKDGDYQQWLLDISKDNQASVSVNSTKVREFKVSGQPEGCVHDDAQSQLYFGQEDYGVWKLKTSALESEAQLIDSISAGNLKDDVEGMSLYIDAKGGHSYLVVSSQGDNAYVLYDLKSDEYVGRFRIMANPSAGVDGVSETDGLAVSSVNFGGVFDQGLLVVQDGRNRFPRDRQNFKLVPWSLIAEGIASQ